MTRRRNACIAAAALTAALLAGCGGDDSESSPPPAAAADSSRVSVKAFMFDPDPLRVAAGTEITWANADATIHTVTTGTRRRPDGRLDAPLDPSGGEFRASFDRPGTYRYFCARHSGPGMTAVVVVE